MSYSLTFARHFARLVWLQINEKGSSYDAHMATLRALVDNSAEGSITLNTQGWQLFVNGAALPERFTGAQDLSAQLIGHSVAELTIDQNASPADILGLSCILAAEPIPGHGGQEVAERLAALGATRVTLRLEMPESGAAPVTEAATASDTVKEESDDLIHEQDPDQLYQVFTAVETPKGSMVKLFDELDASRSDPEMVRQLDALVKLATESASLSRVDIVSDVLHGLVVREADAGNRAKKRVIGMAIRRLTKPPILECVTRLLPRRRENEDQYMTILRRVGDDGVEALVDALVSAPSIADRRAYFDALLKLKSGLRTLVYMLGDERWYVVRNAVELLGEMRFAEAAPEITRLLEHPNDRVRTAASAALAKFDTVDGAKGVRAALRDAHSADVRERAAGTLSHAQGPEATEMLARALDREEDPRVQMALLTALGQIASPEAIDKLIEVARGEGSLFRRRGTPLRVAAVQALGEVKSEMASSALHDLLRDKQKEVRGAASWVMMGRRKGNGKRGG
jgi:HEAT repeat protein